MTLLWLQDTIVMKGTWVTLRSTTLPHESGGRQCLFHYNMLACHLCNIETPLSWWEDFPLIDVLTPFTSTTQPQRTGSSDQRHSPHQWNTMLQFWQFLLLLNAIDAINAATGSIMTCTHAGSHHVLIYNTFCFMLHCYVQCYIMLHIVKAHLTSSNVLKNGQCAFQTGVHYFWKLVKKNYYVCFSRNNVSVEDFPALRNNLDTGTPTICHALCNQLISTWDCKITKISSWVHLMCKVQSVPSLHMSMWSVVNKSLEQHKPTKVTFESPKCQPSRRSETWFLPLFKLGSQPPPLPITSRPPSAELLSSAPLRLSKRPARHWGRSRSARDLLVPWPWRRRSRRRLGWTHQGWSGRWHRRKLWAGPREWGWSGRAWGWSLIRRDADRSCRSPPKRSTGSVGRKFATVSSLAASSPYFGLMKSYSPFRLCTTAQLTGSWPSPPSP